MRNKYNAKKTMIHGTWFDSKKEADRYLELKLLERAGEITNLELQPQYVFKLNGVKICTYRADFRYCEDGLSVVNDVKGYKTQIYKIKKKMMKAFYGIEILET